MPQFKSFKNFVIYWVIALATIALVVCLLPLLFEQTGKRVAESMGKSFGKSPKPSGPKSP